MGRRASDGSFLAYVLEQLSALEGVRARAMFGGHGIYHHENFFAIVHRGRLFKTDIESRGEYLELGMGAFQPTPRQRLPAYYEVPAEILEDGERLVAWARRALAV